MIIDTELQRVLLDLLSQISLNGIKIKHDSDIVTGVRLNFEREVAELSNGLITSPLLSGYP